MKKAELIITIGELISKIEAIEITFRDFMVNEYYKGKECDFYAKRVLPLECDINMNTRTIGVYYATKKLSKSKLKNTLKLDLEYIITDLEDVLKIVERKLELSQWDLKRHEELMTKAKKEVKNIRFKCKTSYGETADWIENTSVVEEEVINNAYKYIEKLRSRDFRTPVSIEVYKLGHDENGHVKSIEFIRAIRLRKPKTKDLLIEEVEMIEKDFPNIDCDELSEKITFIASNKKDYWSMSESDRHTFLIDEISLTEMIEEEFPAMNYVELGKKVMFIISNEKNYWNMDKLDKFDFLVDEILITQKIINRVLGEEIA